MDGQSSRKASVDNCTFVKTILMILVVLYHSMLFWSGSWFTVLQPVKIYKTVSWFAGWLSTFHIYSFVLVSGYLYSFLRFEQGKYNRYGAFISNKMKRLLIPYFSVSLLWAIPFSKAYYDDSLITIIRNYLLGISPSQLWFLLMLFIVFALVWPLSNAIHNSWFWCGLFIVGFYFIGVLGGHFLQNYFQIWTGIQYVPFFIIGMKIRDVNLRDKIISIKLPFLIVILIIDVALYAIYRFIQSKTGTVATCVGIVEGFLLKLTGAVMAFFILQSVANRIQWKNKKILMLLARFSMIIYLLHQQIIWFMICVFNGRINAFFNISICFLGAIIVPCIIASVIFSNRFLKMLFGEK